MVSLVQIGSMLAGHPQFVVCEQGIATCPTHGEYQQTKYKSGRVTKCPECEREREQQRIADETAAAQREAADRKSKLIDELIGNSGIPKRFLSKTLTGYQILSDAQRVVLDAAKMFAQEFQREGGHSGRCLTFLGNTGTGKSHIAAAIALHVIKNCNGTARFTSVSEINRIVRESKSYDASHTETEIITAFGNYDLLIVDEVGIQSGTDAESRALFDVFNARYQNMKPTIVISNLNINQLKDALGERVIDRLKEGGGLILGFNWGSHRQ